MAYPTTNSKWVGDWIDRMAWRWGGTVYDKDGTSHDWGQALCIEMYGSYVGDNWPDDPSLDDIKRAQRWEAGEWPDWVDRTAGIPHEGDLYQSEGE
ncbi:MAG: hypothetical protein MUO70_03185 [Euryarchaeota archaeon]|nr:hypothetical protein [Euryarchaeota archaeon]